MPNDSIWTRYWSETAIKDLAYNRGDVVAMLVDHAICRRSGGERSLDDLMRELVRRGPEHGWKVSTGKLLREIEAWTDPVFAEKLRRIVVEGEIPELPDDLFGADLRVTREDLGTYELGFHLQSLETRKVTGVQDGSAAHEAGLRDGQDLVAWSFRSGDPRHARSSCPSRNRASAVACATSPSASTAASPRPNCAEAGVDCPRYRTRHSLNADNIYTGTDEYDDDRTHNAVNELTARDTDNNGSNDQHLSYHQVGNRTDDDEEHKYQYDAFGQLRKVKTSDVNEDLLAEYKYDGPGHLIPCMPTPTHFIIDVMPALIRNLHRATTGH